MLIIINNPLKETINGLVSIEKDTIPGFAWVEAASWNDDFKFEILEGMMVNDTFYMEKVYEDSSGENTFTLSVPEQFIICFKSKL